jgi:uncharacterized protein
MKLNYLASFISGLLFGAGLVVSGMANPKRVRGFLDIGGAFDPTLAFVMMGALLIMAFAWSVQKKLSHPLFSSNFEIPKTLPVDVRLISGAILFGVGWGLAGLCPGPALVGLVLLPKKAILFVVGMLLGMGLYRWLDQFFSSISPKSKLTKILRSKDDERC